MNDFFYKVWLENIEGLGSIKTEKLLEEFGSPENIYQATKEQLIQIRGIGSELAERIIFSKDEEGIKRKIDIYEKHNIKMIFSTDPEYPMKLNKIYDKPYCIYYIGELPKYDYPVVSMVGSRQASEYGRQMAYSIAKELAGNGIGIVSGMAEGIDGYSHKGALDGNGLSWGVLGCGVDICYPGININIYNRLKEQGGIISEQKPFTKPVAGNFPKRNRIISAISDLLIVVEAGEKSGSLITVDCALEQGVEVFAVPGRITDRVSCGCNNLIKQGASIYTGISDILEFFGLNKKSKCTGVKNNLDTINFLLYSILNFTPKTPDDLIKETGLSMDQVVSGLLELELMGKAKEIFINSYVKVSEKESEDY